MNCEINLLEKKKKLLVVDLEVMISPCSKATRQTLNRFKLSVSHVYRCSCVQPFRPSSKMDHVSRGENLIKVYNKCQSEMSNCMMLMLL